MNKKKDLPRGTLIVNEDADKGSDNNIELAAKIRDLELENDILRQTIEILKKDQGIDLLRLKNAESEEYSYLPEEAKEYVTEAYEATGEVILTEKNKKKNQVYLNPDYIAYLQLTSKEKEKVSNIPDPYTIDYDFRKLEGDLVLPSSYDLRNHNGKNYVGPMKYQSTTGLCWAFNFLKS